MLERMADDDERSFNERNIDEFRRNGGKVGVGPHAGDIGRLGPPVKVKAWLSGQSAA